MKKIGIWIDKRSAHIIIQDADGNQRMKVVNSRLEEYKPLGGSGTAMKGGPQDVVQDSKYLEREKHQFKAYAKDILENLKNAGEILIFGPAQAGERLRTEIENLNPKLASRIMAVKKADSMTENQMKAFVRGYYETNR